MKFVSKRHSRTFFTKSNVCIRLQLSWSPSGETFLAVTGSPQPKVYDREGKELGQFVRGDMYIRDQKNTKGHVSGCTGGQWHPSDR